MPAAEALRLGALNSIHALRWLRHAVVTVWAWLWGSVLYLTKHKGSKLELIQRDVQELQKLPVHLALLVNERQISHSDLARLVNWCFCAGINYVSLYDPRGQHRYVLVFHIQFSYMHVRMTSSQDCRSVCFSHNIIVCVCVRVRVHVRVRVRVRVHVRVRVRVCGFIMGMTINSKLCFGSFCQFMRKEILISSIIIYKSQQPCYNYLQAGNICDTVNLAILASIFFTNITDGKQ